MFGALIGFVLIILIAGFAFWAIQKLLALIPLAEPFATLMQIVLYGIVLLIVIWAIVYLLGLLGVAVPGFASVHIR